MTIKGAAQSPGGIDSGKIITFPAGIPGFEKYTTFRIFHKEENNILAYWLEACDSAEITFTLVDPTSYGLHYEINLTDEEQELLKASDPRAIAVFLILSKGDTLGAENSGLNANIGGPILINPEAKLGIQKVIVRSEVNVKIIQG